MGEIKVIFLDVDGVLNSQYCDARCCGFIGISASKVSLLKQIVEATGAKIVLTSTWKRDYVDYIANGYKNKLGKYLREKFKDKDLDVFDTTIEYEAGDPSNRGAGITNWISAYEQGVENKVVSFAVLDDEIFPDYRKCNILSHLVKTSFYSKNDKEGGLTQDHVNKAINILNTKEE